MRLFLAAIVAVAVTTAARADFVFHDIAWNTPAQTAIKKLTEAGFKVQKKPDHGDYRFRGTLLNRPANGIAVMADGKLVKIVLSLAAPDGAVRSAYDEVRGILIERYGEPEKTVQSYLEPFHEGDGYEQEAIRAGKGIFATEWNDGGQRLLVNISPQLAVELSYESAAWQAELQRRQRF